MKINSYIKDDLNFIVVSNDSYLKVIFCDLGASIFNIYFYDELMTHNVKNIKDYHLKSCYYGKTIGRTCNRLKGHKIVINDQIYYLENNEDDNVLHGGDNGLSTKRFKYLIKEDKDYIEVIFSYISKDSESGYPGNVNLKVRYIIYKLVNKIDIKYQASSDKDTLLSLTNHSYYSLGDSDISKLELFINSHKYLKTDYSTLLPIKINNIDEVRDFNKFKKINKDIDSNLLKGKKMNGYDTYWYFDKLDIKNINASIRNDKYILDIYTDFEGTQIYSSNFKPSFDLSSENKYRDSVAIEPSDSFIKPHILYKGEIYNRNIILEFKKRN